MTLVLPEVRDFVWDWLKPFQKDAVCSAIGMRCYSLHHACGSGKTLDAILWALAEPGPVVVLCPPRIRVQWADEVRKFSHVQPYVLFPVGTPKHIKIALGQRDETLASYLARVPRPFLIVGWQTLHDEKVYKLLKKIKINGLVCDEIHTVRARERWKAEEQMAGLPPKWTKGDHLAALAGFLAPYASRRLGLTATPVYNRMKDLWSQLEIVYGRQAVGSFHDWALNFCAAYEDKFAWNYNGVSNTQNLKLWLDPRRHVVTQDELHALLPPLRRTMTRLDPESQDPTGRDIKRMVKDAAREAHGGTGLEGGELAGRLAEARLMASSARKNTYVAQQIVDCMMSGQKVLVFTGRRVDVGKLRDLVKRNVKGSKLSEYRVWAAHGEDPAEQRELIAREYMNYEGPSCLIGTGEAFGEGLNLNKCDRMIIQLLPWTWGQIRQWEGRAFRLGQDRPLIIEYVIALGTFDELILERVLAKLPAVEAIAGESQVTGVREALQGGTDQELITGVMDALKDMDFDVD